MVATDAGVELESFEAEDRAGVYVSRYETSEMPASMAVIATLSKAVDQLPFEMEPLEEYVNTDALDALFRSTEKTADGTAVTFTVACHTVTVHGDGRIKVFESGLSPPREMNDSGTSND